MTPKKPKPVREPRVTPSKETRAFAAKAESESTAYNWRSRENLKQNRRG